MPWLETDGGSPDLRGMQGILARAGASDDSLVPLLAQLELQLAADPAGAAELVRAARALLLDRPRLLAELFRALHELPARRPAHYCYAPPVEESARIDSVVATLQRDGIARWPGMYSERLLGELEQLTVRALARSKAFMRSGADDSRSVWPDPELGCEHWGTRSSRNGRTRSFFRSDAATRAGVERQLMGDPRIFEIGARYYAAAISAHGLLLEMLEPASDTLPWHVDGILDQFKAMILLADVEICHGPMEYRRGTQRQLAARALWPALHGTFASGRAWSSLGDSVVQQVPGVNELVTGRRGDVIFFDTLGIHRGGMPSADARLVAVGYFGASTRWNAFAQQVRGDANL